MIECTDNPPDRALLGNKGSPRHLLLGVLSHNEDEPGIMYLDSIAFAADDALRSASFQHPNVSNIKEHNKFPYNNLAFLLTRALLMIQYSAQCELLTKKYTTFLEMAIEKSNFFLKGAIL